MSKKTFRPKILLTIPTLNNLTLLKGTLESIASVYPLYYFFIDNGSDDGSQEYLKKLAKTPGVFFFESKINLGAAGSWNLAIEFGIKELGCTKIAVLNNDIILAKETLDLMFDGLERPETGMCTAFNVSGRLASASDFIKLKNPAKGDLKETPDFSCFAVSKECIDKVGLFDEVFYPAYFEDNDFHYRMRLENLKAVCDHRAIYFHYGSRSRNLTPDFRAFLDSCYLKNRDYYKKKWGGEPGNETLKEPFGGKGPDKIEIPEISFSAQSQDCSIS